MFFIKVTTIEHDTGQFTTDVIGYTDTEEAAIQYCKMKASKLNFRESSISKHYTYGALTNLAPNKKTSYSNTSSNNTDEILSNPDAFRF